MSETPARRGGRRVERLLAAVGALAPLVKAERARLDRWRLVASRRGAGLVAGGQREPGGRARSGPRARRRLLLEAVDDLWRTVRRGR